MTKRRTTLKFGERWVDCGAARSAYDAAKIMRKDFKDFQLMSSGQLSRITGRNEPGKTKSGNRILFANIKAFAELCGVEVGTLLINGDGLSPPEDNHREASSTICNQPLILARKRFSTLLKAHLRTNTSPDGNRDKPWTYASFAEAVANVPNGKLDKMAVSKRHVEKWCRGSLLPMSVEPILLALFGPVARKHAAEREELREAYIEAKLLDSNGRPPDSRQPTLQSSLGTESNLADAGFATATRDLALGHAFLKADRYLEAVDVYSDIIEPSRLHPSARADGEIAVALHNKALALDMLDRTEEAVATCQLLLLRFAQAKSSDIRKLVQNANAYVGTRRTLLLFHSHADGA